jgi:acyl-CoA thioesterase-1
VVGDSLSAEYGLTRGSGWVALLEQKLKARKDRRRIVNASISGETTSGGRARLPALLAQHKPDVVVIELGANDGLRGLPVDAAEDNLRADDHDGAASSAPRSAGRHAHAAELRPRLHGALLRHVQGRSRKNTRCRWCPSCWKAWLDKPALFQPTACIRWRSAHPIILNNIWPHLFPLIKNK